MDILNGVNKIPTRETKDQRYHLSHLKGPGFGTSTETWERLKLEILLDMKDLLVILNQKRRT